MGGRLRCGFLGRDSGGAAVPSEFDPYHRWLGIPPSEQPANHYRLLGLSLFECDREVIRDGAAQRMAHVRTYQLGPNSELSQKILNELAVAKACLLDPGKKAEYDARLRALVAAQSSPTESPHETTPESRMVLRELGTEVPTAPAPLAPNCPGFPITAEEPSAEITEFFETLASLSGICHPARARCRV